MRSNIIEAVLRTTGYQDVGLETSGLSEFGDYSSNIAMILAKKEGKKPQDVAGGLAEKLRKDAQLSKTIEKIDVAGPGFINFHLSRNVLVHTLEEIIKSGDKYGSANLGKGKIVVIDYSSPNIAKRFGIGHMRSTIIGQAIYNLYSFLGYKVIGDNHLGDWGTQFGVLLRQITKSTAKQDPALQGKLQISNLTIDKLEKLYVEFNKKVEDNPKLWDEAREWFKKLEDGSTEARKIWKEVVDISRGEFERIYKLLGVHIDQALGESFYEDKMPEIIEIIRKKKLSKKSQGAEIVKFSDLSPAMLVKGDGATTYYTRDLATLKFRIEEWNPDLIIYEVGSEQTLHFRQLFATAKLLGWDKGRHLVHVAHGLIRFKSGKMSTRRGLSIKLEEVLSESIDRAGKIINKSETSRGLAEKDKQEVVKAVGIGAIKYFDLKHHPSSDIIFDWEKMFVLEGNSAPYLQYTFARTQSVLRKAQSSKLKAKSNLPSALSLKLNAEELSVMRSLVHFPEVIEDAANAYSPNLLCNYLFDLAQKYNTFYNNHRIIGSEQEATRLAITGAAGQILENGLKILGIETPERM